MNAQSETLSLALDAGEACLIRNGSRLPLSPKDFALLHHLVLHRGRVIPHDELLQAAWPDTHISPEVLKVRIGRLRRILGDDARSPRFIKSVHGEGYRFIASATIHLPSIAERQVLGGDGVLTRIAPASEHRADTTIVGREEELTAMRNASLLAASGTRQLVLLSGEPGVGKTTLIDLFLHDIQEAGPGMPRADAVWIGRGQSVELYGKGEPYLPVTEALERMARASRRESFIAAMRQYAPTWLLQLPALLSVDDRAALQQQLRQPSRDRMLRELADAIEVLSLTSGSNGPPLVILVLEDLHWADPSTIDFLAVLARRREPARLLVIGSWRPVEASTPDHPLLALVREMRACEGIKELLVGPLNESDIARYLEARFAGNVFSPELARRLCQRTEGNALFFTGVVRDLLTSHVIAHTGDGWVFNGDLDAIGVMTPASIRQLVIRQCERLTSHEQRLLESASIAGVEFSAATLAAALADDSNDVEEQCLRLAERQQFLRLDGSEEWPDGTQTTRFAFLHAIYREVWQERLGLQRRQESHLRIGERKEAAYGPRAHEIATELALHFEQGRDYRRAVTYHDQACWQAVQRVAETEARGHLDQAFAALQRLPDTPERLRLELRLQLGLGALVAMTGGYGAAETARAYRRARLICEEIGDAPEVFHATYGLCRFFWIRGELEEARELGGQLLRIAEHHSDPVQLMAAHAALTQVFMVRGELNEAVAHGQEGLAWYRGHWQDWLSPVYGHLGILCAGPLASASQMLGYPDQATTHLDAMMRFAEQSSHPFARGLAHWGACIFHHVRGDVDRVAHSVDELSRIWSAQDTVEFAPFGDVFRGWASAMHGRAEEGVVLAARGVETLRRLGADLFQPYALSLVAECHGQAGCTDQALVAVEEAIALAAGRSEGWYDAELHRLRGHLLLASETTTPDGARGAEAERSFDRALAIARRQGATWWEQRARRSLDQLAPRRGDGVLAQTPVHAQDDRLR